MVITEGTVKRILEVFNECAPSANSRDCMCEALAEAESLDNTPPRILVRMVAQALVDGLQFGNWIGEPYYPRRVPNAL